MLRLRAAAVSLVTLAMLAGERSSALPLYKSSSAANRSLFERAQAVRRGPIDPDRHCQTVRECRFTRGGSFRGCISAYSCRTCEFVPARCTISGSERTCQRLRCHWGD
jgi:hypothetical protein